MLIPTIVPGRLERLEARISPEVKQLIQEAADLEGRTMSEFLITSAQAAAKKVIEEYQTMKLTVSDRNAFVSALLNAPEPSPKLRAAAKRYKEVSGG
ncbi:MAG: DUF1778 domain-containing protein [Candidatus Solibacter sp.]